jgi:hypothetical protein
MNLEGQDKQQATDIGDAIQAHHAVDTPEGSILVKWVVVADWCKPDGERCLTRIHSDGETIWEAFGLLHAGIGLGWDEDE